MSSRCGQFDHDSKMICNEHTVKGTTSLIREDVRDGSWKRGSNRLELRNACLFMIQESWCKQPIRQYHMLMKATTRCVSLNSGLTWRHNDIYLKNTNTDKHVTEPIQRQREAVPKTKQASTATILDYNVSDVLVFK